MKKIHLQLIGFAYFIETLQENTNMTKKNTELPDVWLNFLSIQRENRKFFLGLCVRACLREIIPLREGKGREGDC